jgi:outer membrane receptor for ferrienterochelin and colicins
MINLVKKIVASLVILFVFNYTAWAQQYTDSLQGKVELQTLEATNFENGKTIIAIGAKLQWLGYKSIYTTNPLGAYYIPKPPKADKLIVSYTGYFTDTISIPNTSIAVNIVLKKKSKKDLAAVTIAGSKKTAEVSYISTIQQLNIGKGELLKAACCNLSESFETTPSVDVSFTDAITGQKQIQMLGLATPYTLITQENIPMIRGLASIAGLNLTPGTWVQSMQLSKGTSSVVNGYESLAGQINVELAKPDGPERALLNVYQNSGGRSEVNFNYMQPINKNWKAGILMHYKNQWFKQDMNMDHFMDNPLGTQLINLGRFQYFNNKGWEVQGGIKLSNANALGGTMHSTIWQYTDTTNRLETWIKIGKVNPKKQWQSTGLQLSYTQHQQNMQVPNWLYIGKQNSLYANLIHQGVIGNTNHQYKVGASYVQDFFAENLPSTTINKLQRLEQVPGIFAEHTYSYIDKLSVVTGLRADYHNLFGWFATPRLHIRYVPYKQTAIRLSAGRSQRTANVFTENQGAYFSNRQFVLVGNPAKWSQGLLPEIAWNTGLSITHPFKLNYKKGTLVLDYYYTWFQQQVLADYESPRQVLFYTIYKQSYSHSFQAQADYTIINRKLDARLAYRWYDVQAAYRNQYLFKPLVSKHRAFLNLSYTTSTKFKWDYTLIWNGTKRLPNAFKAEADTAFVNGNSPNFFIMNAHLSKMFLKQHDVYIGVENLTNYKQPSAIISAANPLSTDFDASQTWGPIMGYNIYVGYRWLWKNKYK